MNGRRHGELVDYFRSYPDQILATLSNMDGDSFFAWQLWELPEGARHHDVDVVTLDQRTYIQCAGSADAMSVEVRAFDDDGVPHQLIVGRPGSREGEPGVAITFAENTLHVYELEVFNATEAAGIFYQYFLDGTIPAQYVTREFDMTRPTS
ncbi:hypothetical protein [Agromyces atrinae]|nr:hypothetical protein [Agromyces atrinae]NYD66374.1 hypothetical protein [Agromyces atrinae]